MERRFFCSSSFDGCSLDALSFSWRRAYGLEFVIIVICFAILGDAHASGVDEGQIAERKPAQERWFHRVISTASLRKRWLASTLGLNGAAGFSEMVTTTMMLQ